MKDGAAASTYSFDTSMKVSADGQSRSFKSNDGDIMFLPGTHAIEIKTEFGVMHVEPLEMGVVPRGITFQINTVGGRDGELHSGYMLENFGDHFVIPHLGPIGISSGLAHPRQFVSPEASFDGAEATKTPGELVVRFQDKFWKGATKSSPYDVVAFYGSLLPCKYDLRNFNAIGSVTYDHPDPSIGCVMSSYTHAPGVANIDFVVFAPRYVCMENTYRPPWFHRNCMSEFMGLIKGAYDAKAGFVPGACSIHNQFVGHGPDTPSVAAGSKQDTTKVEREYILCCILA